MNYRFGIVLFFFAAVLISLGTAAIYNRGNLLALFFPESITVGELKAKYQTQHVRVLIVPGHDNEFSGTQFRGTREADVTLRLGSELFKLFAADPKFQVFVTRDEHGYVPEFSNYFAQDHSNIVSFRERLKNTMSALFETGLVEKQVGMYHNFAKQEVSVRLYGMNKWANEHAIDLVIHIHFNDYPGHTADAIGTYSGFSMYVPEGQLPNARASREIAQSVFSELKNTMSVSSYPPEQSGVVEDQELIAIGANASLNATAFLTEYGYIYESPLRRETVRSYLFRELAYQTYAGVKKFFAPDYKINQYDSKLLPHYWDKDLSLGMTDDTDVASLQKVLRLEGIYSGPLTGNFFELTREAVMAFQKKHNFDSGSVNGRVGPHTRTILNDLYSDS